MTPFTKLSGTAAPLPMANVDTDAIIPKQFLKTIKRTGLGKHLFHNLRYQADGAEIADFILNRPAYRAAPILVTGANFGCGSSREHAPWALADFGIRAVIAPSFADIFFNNCFKNGILPIILPQDQIDALMEKAAEGTPFTINLDTQTVVVGNHSYAFEVDAFRKHCLLNGLDDIGLTEQHKTDINSFESTRATQYPWMTP